MDYEETTGTIICIHTDRNLEVWPPSCCSFFLNDLDFTFSEFITEGAVKPLAAVQPAHRWTHEGSAPPAALHALRLLAHLQGVLEPHTNVTEVLEKTLHFPVKISEKLLTSAALCFARGVTSAPRGSRLSRAT